MSHDHSHGTSTVTRTRRGRAPDASPSARPRTRATSASVRSRWGSAARWAAERPRSLLELCRRLRGDLRLGVVTNDIFTREDAEFLIRHDALPAGHIRAVETGGCPHAAIREDVSHNLLALEELVDEVGAELLFVESGGDNLAAQYSRELADFTIYVIDVAGGDKVPRKGGPGITQSDLLVINKTDLAPHVGADLAVMERDAAAMRGDGPTVFAQVVRGVGVDEITSTVLAAREAADRTMAR